MNALIVCSNYIKEKKLDSFQDKFLMNISFMTKDEFKRNYYFDYTKETVYYLIQKYNYKYDNALEYIKNLYYIEDKVYHNDKLDFLVSLNCP